MINNSIKDLKLSPSNGLSIYKSKGGSNIISNPIGYVRGTPSVKTPIPSLVEKGLIKHIAKHNNIDFNTGNELPSPPTEFQLLCYEVKDSIIRFIRNNWLLLSLLLIIIICLYNRYNTVKRRKKLLNKQYNNQ